MAFKGYTRAGGKIAPGTSYTGAFNLISIETNTKLSAEKYDPTKQETVDTRALSELIATVVGSTFLITFVGETGVGTNKYKYVFATDRAIVTDTNKFNASQKTTVERIQTVLTGTDFANATVKVEVSVE